MSINTFFSFFALLVLSTIGSCGGNSSGGKTPPVPAEAAPSFQVSVLPETYRLGGSAQRIEASLNPAGQSAAGQVVVDINVTGAEGLKSLYFTVQYDPQQYRALASQPTGLMGPPQTLLSLALPTARGTLEYGQVLVAPDDQPGWTGSGVVAQITFSLGPELALRAVSSAGPPQTAASQTTNLAFDGTDLTWTYFQQGDYDQNGETNAADLTPIAQHFRQTSPAGPGTPWPPAASESQIDGDSNGEINASDITPIAQNFKCNSLGGFHVYKSSQASEYPADSPPLGPNGAGTTELTMGPGTPPVAVTAAVNYAARGTQRLTFLFNVAGPVANDYYWIRPADATGTLGIASNQVGGNPSTLPELSLDPATPTPPVAGDGSLSAPYQLDDTVDYSFKLLATPGGADVTNDPTTVFMVQPAAAGAFARNMLDIADGYDGDYTVTATYGGVQNHPGSNVYCRSGTAPTVISTAPADSEANIALNTRPSATFSEAMDPQTITDATFTLMRGPTAVAGVVTYIGVTAIFTPTADLLPDTTYTAQISQGATDLTGHALAGAVAWTFQTGAALDTTRPTVLSTLPATGATNVPIASQLTATFSEAMDPQTVTNGSFVLLQGITPIAGSVSYAGMTAGFNPTSDLLTDTVYTAKITSSTTDLAGNALAADYVWTFRTAIVDLGGAAPFGSFGGGSGMTNQGILTVINGDIGTTGAPTMMTGFHDTGGDVYTETPLNKGQVNGIVFTAPPAPGTPEKLAIASQAAADAQAAFDDLSPGALPGGTDPGAGELGGLTLPPDVYQAAGGTFKITGSNLTLDAQGDPDAVWVFQAATTLTVGDTSPRSVILLNGAQAKNVYWYVGSAATINGAGGGTMVGTILASAGITFSTAGNVTVTVLDGRAIGLNASVTLVNTRINTPQ